MALLHGAGMLWLATASSAPQWIALEGLCCLTQLSSVALNGLSYVADDVSLVWDCPLPCQMDFSVD